MWRLGAIVVKLYNVRRKNPLFANASDREAAVLKALDGQEIAPKFVGMGRYDGRPWIAYQHEPGGNWREMPASVARLLSQIHCRPVSIDLPRGKNGSAELQKQTYAILNAQQDVGALTRLKPRTAVSPTKHLSLIHGDPVAGNLVCGPKGLRLIDWQCPQIGDPAEDLAIFLSPAMQYLYRGEALTAIEEQEFLETYQDRHTVRRYLTLKPWYHWRMAAYCQWRGQNGEAQDLIARDLEIAALTAT